MRDQILDKKNATLSIRDKIKGQGMLYFRRELRDLLLLLDSKKQKYSFAVLVRYVENLMTGM